MNDTLENTAECRAKISAVEAQHLTVRILSLLPVAVSMNLLRRLDLPGQEKAYPSDVRKHLLLCIGLGNELRDDPNRYSSLQALCEAALRRQKGKDFVQKKEYGEALGVNKIQRNRMEKGTAAPTLEQIRRLCHEFSDAADRRFWENMFLDRYPEIADMGRGEGPEETALQALLRLLAELGHTAAYDEAVTKLNPKEKRALKDLDAPEAAALDLKEFGREADRLYPVITSLARKQEMLIAELAEEEIGASMNTWYAWKREWERAENEGFKQGLPKTRLKRVHMMLLAILFKLNYFQSVYFLALAGYRYISGEPDNTVLQALYSDTFSREGLLCYLRQGITTGSWQPGNKNCNCK